MLDTAKPASYAAQTLTCSQGSLRLNRRVISLTGDGSHLQQCRIAMEESELIPRLYGCWPADAVQVVNHHHISHQIYRETASQEPFQSILKGFQRYAPVLSIDDYARLFFACGAEEIIVFEKVYAHVLEDSDAVVEWISGTALVPYFERLGEHKEEFINAIRAKMRGALPDRPVFYPFRRTLFSARKPKP
jgi:trans-aconitate 2-methyltransferase